MALTQAQIAQHWGAMLDMGLDRLAAADPPPDSFTPLNFVRLAVRYVLNGTLSTQANRREAMQPFVRRLCIALSARDPATDGEFFLNHFLPSDDETAGTVIG